MRPLVGVPAARRRASAFLCADIARGPDGRWWVLRDRTQAPSGAGFALENRLALRQSIPDIYRNLHVHRHAPFFPGLQAELTGLNRQNDSRVCVLTPGPMNETYFEHAYLARYLGFLLVEPTHGRHGGRGVFDPPRSGRYASACRGLDDADSDAAWTNRARGVSVPAWSGRRGRRQRVS